MPNRTVEAFGGGWAWRAGDEQFLYTPEQLLDCYIRSVGRNSNLLLGMAISVDGEFQDEAQFRAFGQLLRDTFSHPLASLEKPVLADHRVTLTLPETRKISYVVIREDITEGQKIRGFRILADGRSVYESQCIGHKRIIPFEGLTARTITLEITQEAAPPQIRDIQLF